MLIRKKRKTHPRIVGIKQKIIIGKINNVIKT